MAKIGRPRSENAKRKMIGIRLTDTEYDKLLRYAFNNNLTISETIHQLIKQLDEKTKSF